MLERSILIVRATLAKRTANGSALLIVLDEESDLLYEKEFRVDTL